MPHLVCGVANERAGTTRFLVSELTRHSGRLCPLCAWPRGIAVPGVSPLIKLYISTSVPQKLAEFDRARNEEKPATILDLKRMDWYPEMADFSYLPSLSLSLFILFPLYNPGRSHLQSYIPFRLTKPGYSWYSRNLQKSRYIPLLTWHAGNVSCILLLHYVVLIIV